MFVNEAARTTKPRRRQTAAAVPSVEAAQRWRVLMDISNDAIVVLSAEDASVIEASQSFSDLLGYSLAELEGKHSWDWDALSTKANVLGSLEGDRRRRPGTRWFETQLRRKDGTIIEVEVGASWTDWQGTGQIVCIMRDVTERNAKSRALREETRLRRLGIESSREGIVIMALDDYVVIDANSAFAGLLQREPWEVIGMHPWDWDATMSRQEIVARGAQAGVGGGTPSRSHCRDITERKRVERALRESESKFRAMFESTRRGISLLSRDGRHLERDDLRLNR